MIIYYTYKFEVKCITQQMGDNTNTECVFTREYKLPFQLQKDTLFKDRKIRFRIYEIEVDARNNIHIVYSIIALNKYYNHTTQKEQCDNLIEDFKNSDWDVKRISDV